MANRDASTRETSSHSQRMVSPVLRIALLLGIAVHLAGFLIFRVVSNPLPDREPAAAFVQFLSTGLMAGDADLEEKAILFDSAPLFIPTRWNASSRIFTGIGVVDRQLPDFEPAIDLTADLQPSTRVLADSDPVAEPIDLLALRYWNFLTRLPGHRDGTGLAGDCTFCGSLSAGPARCALGQSAGGVGVFRCNGAGTGGLLCPCRWCGGKSRAGTFGIEFGECRFRPGCAGVVGASDHTVRATTGIFAGPHLSVITNSRLRRFTMWAYVISDEYRKHHAGRPGVIDSVLARAPLVGHLLYGNGPAVASRSSCERLQVGCVMVSGVRTKTASSLPATMDFAGARTPRGFVTVMSKRPCMRSKTPLRMLRGVVCR